MDRPNKINLVEVGPGKGTLMKDMLRVIFYFHFISKKKKKNSKNFFLLFLGIFQDFSKL